MKRYRPTRAPKKPRTRLRQPTPAPSSFGENLVVQCALFVGCVLLPSFFFFMAPFSVVRFTRTAGEVRAEISKRLWYVVPYRHLRVEGVTSIDSSRQAGTTNYSYSDRRTVTSEDSAALRIIGRSGEARAEISPANVDDARRKVRDFLEDPSEGKLTLIAVANWKFTVFAGGCLTLLTLLYVYSMVGAFVRWVVKHVRGSAPIREEAGSAPFESELGERLP